MDVRILDLDGALTSQDGLIGSCQLCPLRDWGPSIRIACAFSRFRRFQKTLEDRLGSEADHEPRLSLVGSGDFHHVSLALVSRLARPFNLLVLDNHPDWMRGIPFLHCGTWLWHAARLANLQQVFHVGGEVDFDNHYRWLAPWQLLRSGKITVLPAIRRFRAGAWARTAHQALRAEASSPASPERIEALLEPYAQELARHPLYISLDKDVMGESESIVNWDSGHLKLAEVSAVLRAFCRAARGNLAGMDIVGDWSPVRLQGWFRRAFHWTEHPWMVVDPLEAARRNQQTNRTLINQMQAHGLEPVAS